MRHLRQMLVTSANSTKKEGMDEKLNFQHDEKETANNGKVWHREQKQMQTGKKRKDLMISVLKQ